MKAWIPLTLVLALGSAAAQAACVYPRAPDAPPDGNTATKEQMIAAKHDFNRYNTEMNAYLDCMKLEIDARHPRILRSSRPIRRKRPTNNKRCWCRRTTPPSTSSKQTSGDSMNS